MQVRANSLNAMTHALLRDFRYEFLDSDNCKKLIATPSLEKFS